VIPHVVNVRQIDLATQVGQSRGPFGAGLALRCAQDDDDGRLTIAFPLT